MAIIDVVIRNGRYEAVFSRSLELEQLLAHAGFKWDTIGQKWWTDSLEAVGEVDAASWQRFTHAAYVERMNPRPQIPTNAPNVQIPLGLDSEKRPVSISLKELIVGRFLIQGSSRSGKTHTIKKILAGTRGHVQQIIIDCEGDYIPYAQQHKIAIVNHDDPAQAAMHFRRNRASVLLDVSQMKASEYMHAVGEFVTALIEAPQTYWTPALVVIDEAQLYAPTIANEMVPPKTRKHCLGAMIDLMSRGGKRGLAGILATQRLARLNASVRSEAWNHLVGLTAHDTDIKRAAEALGWSQQQAFGVLPNLHQGMFVASGQAFGAKPYLVSIAA